MSDTPSETAVQFHLNLLQSIVSRMAANSASCKTWCVTLVSAILVLTAEREKALFALVGLTPVLVFACLDAFYLALERAFRSQYSAFVQGLASGTITSTDLYVVTKPVHSLRSTAQAFCSPAVWPTYTVLLAVALAVAIHFM